jgi:hypothetical protein
MPRSISFERFDFGLDLRKGASTSDANRLRVLKNAYTTEGRTIRKRPGTTLVATLEPGTTGLFAGNGKLNTFYGGTSTITHANSTFQAHNVQSPTTPALALTEVHYADVFNGYIYAAVEYTGGEKRHHYIDGSATFTVTIASPAVFTQADHGYVAGRALVFSTTGSLPTGLTAGTTYYVIATGLTTSAYQVSLTPGGAAVNTSGAQSGVHTVRQRTYITDTNCPHSKQVIKISSKIWSPGVNGDTVRFSKTNNPRDWTTSNDAGFLPVGLQQSGANEAKALGFYTNRLVVFFADSSQIWQVDVDPAKHLFLQAVDVGATLPYSHANMSGDVFFLSPAGVRTITRQDVTTNLIDSDVGSPIDRELLKGTYISLTNPKAQYYRGGGQYWLYSGNTAVVFTFSRTSGVSAWSVYEFPYTLDYLDELNAELYIRSGDNVYKFDRTVYTDDGELYSVDIELSYLDFKLPGVLKLIQGMDAVVTGTCEISHRFDPRNTDLITSPAVTIEGDSRPSYIYPVELAATNLAPVIHNMDDEEFELHALTYYFESMGLA